MSRQVKDASILKIDGKELLFKRSDIKLFLNLKSSINEVERVLRESGKIPDSKRKEFIANMTEGYLSVMLVLHDVLTSSLDVRYHSVSRMTLASYSATRNLLDAFLAAGAAARTQSWLAWEIMTQYNCLASCHTKLLKRLNGATITALKKAVCALEEQRKGVKDLGDYLVEVAVPSLQMEEGICTLLDDSSFLQLEEYQISQLHNLLERVKTLLEWKRSQD